MPTFLYKTKENPNPKGKPRVYFTCHPDDFERYFVKICEDIFKAHDCVIYYTENMAEEIDEVYKEGDLAQMNLFVIPVTFKLLSQPNRAMNSDFCCAKEHNIPVLPIMMESELDEIYSKEDKFGELQYLYPYTKDLTAISYEEKLKKYLESILISSKMVYRIRKEFDAYIFLSYRKKDRHYANELMHLIHSNYEFRDIAIWYDEFLMLGESFRENIGKVLNQSKVFVLLVTPNLLEEPNGKPNFVMEQEYPIAQAKEMTILPVEMAKTSRFKLKRKYKGIKGFINPYNKELLCLRLTNALQEAKVYKHANTPEHNYLIGLAYLNGIDVEKDNKRGIKLITSAADANYGEAIIKLYNMYMHGEGVSVDYKKAISWAERLVKLCKELYGEEDSKTLGTMMILAMVYHEEFPGNPKALELLQEIYVIQCKTRGQNDPDTLKTFENIICICADMAEAHMIDPLQFPDIFQKLDQIYEIKCETIGTKDRSTLKTLRNLAILPGKMGNPLKSLELLDQAYEIHCQALGEEDPDTLKVLEAIATIHSTLGDRKKAWELQEKLYTLQCKILGANHPDTIWLMDFDGTQLEFSKKLYEIHCNTLGETHPDTLRKLLELAIVYNELGDYRKAFDLTEKVYFLYCEMFGEKHPKTIKTQESLEEYRKKLKN